LGLSGFWWVKLKVVFDSDTMKEIFCLSLSQLQGWWYGATHILSALVYISISFVDISKKPRWVLLVSDFSNCIEKKRKNFRFVFKVEAKVMSKTRGFFFSQFLGDVNLIKLRRGELLNALLKVAIPVATGQFSESADVLLLAQLKVGFPNCLSIN
jgi:hypothetical protein